MSLFFQPWGVEICPPLGTGGWSDGDGSYVPAVTTTPGSRGNCCARATCGTDGSATAPTVRIYVFTLQRFTLSGFSLGGVTLRGIEAQRVIRSTEMTFSGVYAKRIFHSAFYAQRKLQIFVQRIHIERDLRSAELRLCWRCFRSIDLHSEEMAFSVLRSADLRCVLRSAECRSAFTPTTNWHSPRIECEFSLRPTGNWTALTLFAAGKK